MATTVRLPSAVVDHAISKAPAPSQSAQRELAGVRVLVDAFNLRHANGSGIKTYGSTLIDALRSLEAEVTLLTDRRKRRAPLEALNEVLFFDAAQVPPEPERPIFKAAKLARIFLGLKRPEEISLGKMLAGPALPEELPVENVLNLPQCYESANSVFRRSRLVSRISLDHPVDVWHATYPLPIAIRGAKRVTTVHDLIPLKLPQTTLDDKVFFFRCMRESLAHSDLVLTVSENTRQDVLSTFDIDPSRVVVTHQPAPRSVPPSDAFNSLVLRKHRLDSGRFILFVGNIEPKKNLGRLLEAFSCLETELPLVVVGRKAWLWEKELRFADALQSEHRHGSRLRMLDYLPRPELEVLYANATCLAFPSLYEGFGLPPLEAMSFDCPVLTSKTSSMPEICGDAAIYVDPYSVDDIREKLGQLVGSERLRRKLITKGAQRVRWFSMENYQRRLASAYARLFQA